MEDSVTLHLFAEDYSPPQFWRLVRWCKDHSAGEWNVTVLKTRKGKKSGTDMLNRFDEQAAPFRLPDARRRHLTSQGASGSGFIRPLELWRLTSKSLTFLEEAFPVGVFRYDAGADGWMEDPMFYRQGELMLGVVSHEGEGILRVTPEERRQLEQDGFPFRLHGTYVGY